MGIKNSNPFWSLLVLIFSIGFTDVNAQPTEARGYQNLPIGTNLFQTNLVYQNTNTNFDMTLPQIEGLGLKIYSAAFRYANYMNVGGKTGGFQIIVPYAGLNVDVLGSEKGKKVNGFGDIIVGFGTNFIGAPAVTTEQFLQYKPDLILSGSLLIRMPTGQYDKNQVFNLGANRWAFKPELALIKVFSHKFWAEMYTNMQFFTANKSMYNPATKGHDKLTQKPLFGPQFHFSYDAAKYTTISFDAYTRFGGATSTNNVSNDNSQSVFALGGSILQKVGVQHSVGITYYGTVSQKNGPDGWTLLLKYNYLFGKPWQQMKQMLKKQEAR